jgi:hypothetical protein
VFKILKIIEIPTKPVTTGKLKKQAELGSLTIDNNDNIIISATLKQTTQ